MKYRVDYEFEEDVTCFSVKNGILYDCLLDDRPFREITYVNLFLEDENGNIIPEEKNKIHLQNFVLHYSLKRNFTIIQNFNGEEDIYSLYDENKKLIAKNMVHRSMPRVSLDGTISNRL